MSSRNNRRIFFMLTALVTMLIIPVPMLLYGEVLTFKTISGGRFFIYYAIIGALVAAGYFVARAYKSHSFRSKNVFTIAKISTRCAAIAPFLLGLIIAGFLGFNGVFGAIVGLVAVYGYYLGYRLYRRDFVDMMTLTWFIGYMMSTLLFCALYASEAPDSIKGIGNEIILWNSVVFVCLSALLINQAHISFEEGRRRENKTIIPKSLRLYNLRLLLPVFGVIILLFLLRGVIVRLFELIGGVIYWLIDMAIGDEEEIPPTAPDFDGEQAVPDMALGTNDIFMVILLLVIGAGVLFLLIRFRREIARGIGNLFKWFLSVLRLDKRFLAPEQSGYRDFVESIAPTREKKRPASDKKRLKAAVKKFRRESDPVEKIRAAYRVYMLWLKTEHLVLTPSQTTDDHRKLANGASKSYDIIAEIEKLKAGYENARYGEIPPTDEALDAANSLINALTAG